MKSAKIFSLNELFRYFSRFGCSTTNISVIDILCIRHVVIAATAVILNANSLMNLSDV